MNLSELAARVAPYVGLHIGRFVPLTTPLTSTAWDGDAYSTVGSSTLIDLSAVFGVPANVKAISVTITCRDSGSAAATNLGVQLGPSNTYYYAGDVKCSGIANDAFASVGPVAVPCNADGDIYYRLAASGAGTLDVWLRIWGYWK